MPPLPPVAIGADPLPPRSPGGRATDDAARFGRLVEERARPPASPPADPPAERAAQKAWKPRLAEERAAAGPPSDTAAPSPRTPAVPNAADRNGTRAAADPAAPAALDPAPADPTAPMGAESALAAAGPATPPPVQGFAAFGAAPTPAPLPGTPLATDGQPEAPPGAPHPAGPQLAGLQGVQLPTELPAPVLAPPAPVPTGSESPLPAGAQPVPPAPAPVAAATLAVAPVSPGAGQPPPPLSAASPAESLRPAMGEGRRAPATGPQPGTTAAPAPTPVTASPSGGAAAPPAAAALLAGAIPVTPDGALSPAAALPEGALPPASAAPLAGQPGPAAAAASSAAAAAAGRAPLPHSPAGQIITRIEQASADGHTRFALRLYPEELGRVEVLLEFQDGRVQATITAERAATLELLQRDARWLERAMEQGGFKLGQDGLQFALRDGRSDPGDGPGGRRAARLAAAGLTGPEEGGGPLSPPMARRLDGLIDIQV